MTIKLINNYTNHKRVRTNRKLHNFILFVFKWESFLLIFFQNSQSHSSAILTFLSILFGKFSFYLINITCLMKSWFI